jgi:DNA ligase-1
MLNKFFNVVETLKQTNSATEKLQILGQYKNDEDVCKFFRYAYDPFFLYGVSSKNLKKNSNLAELEFFDSIFDLLDILKSGQATGNKAISLVNGFINQHFKFEELLYDFFDRNLKIGMGITQINKALGNIIPVFDVALASTYDESKELKYNLDKYCIQRKCNGLRLITIITHDKNTGKTDIRSYSRKGKEFTTCGNINNELLEYYKQSKYYGQNLVFDGEVCIIDGAGKEDWNRAVSEAKKKNHTMANPRYTIFDFLTLDEFSGVSVSRDYTFRRDQMIRNFFGLSMEKFKYLNIIFATPYTKEKRDILIRDFVETEKWEGLIFRRIDVPYRAGRTTDLIKFKLFKDAEYRVIDLEYTEKPILVGGKMVETKCVGALVFELENGSICKVGTGMSDEQRLAWYRNPSSIIGKQIQVKYKEKTKQIGTDNNEVWSLLFPVLVHVFEEDRDF